MSSQITFRDFIPTGESEDGLPESGKDRCVRVLFRARIGAAIGSPKRKNVRLDRVRVNQSLRRRGKVRAASEHLGFGPLPGERRLSYRKRGLPRHIWRNTAQKPRGLVRFVWLYFRTRLLSTRRWRPHGRGKRVAHRRQAVQENPSYICGGTGKRGEVEIYSTVP